jgi:hypothetical protein
MAANVNIDFGLKVEKKENSQESCAPPTPKRQLEKLVRELFEGHEEYLGLTPD